MATKWAIYLQAGAFVLVAIAAIIFLGRTGDTSRDTPAEVLNRNGYLEIRPATNLAGPGAIVTVDRKTDKFVMLHPTCNMNWTEVSALWQSSHTIDTSIASKLNGEFKLSVDMLKRVGLDVGGNGINEIDMKFENTKIIVLTDEDRIGLEKKYLKDNCLNAVLQINSFEKKCVTQPISAMQADINYRVKISDSVAASDKAKILNEVSAALATEGRTDTSNNIIGKDLFVGIKLATLCIVPNLKDGQEQPAKSIESLPVTDLKQILQ